MITHPSMTDDLNQRLRVMMDEAVEERARINRRIRSLRELLSAVERGEALEPDIELAALLTGAQRPTVRLVEPPQEPLRPALVYPTGSGLVTRLGAGLPAGMLSPVALPPPAAVVAPPSVDVGRLGRMSPEELDALAFGVVTLDHRGRVIEYNDTESRLAGVPKEQVIGRNFFTDIAPCSRVKEFEGRYQDFASGRSRLGMESFEFVFHFSHGAQRVLILFSPARLRGQFFVSMIRR